jgi:hypothetical protein
MLECFRFGVRNCGRSRDVGHKRRIKHPPVFATKSWCAATKNGGTRSIVVIWKRLAGIPLGICYLCRECYDNNQKLREVGTERALRGVARLPGGS